MSQLGAAFVAVTTVSALFLVAVAIGVALLRAARATPPGLLLVALGAALGLAELSIVFTLAGLAGWFTPSVIGGILLLHAIVAWRAWPELFMALAHTARGVRAAADVAHRLPLALLLALIVISFPQAVAPPTDADTLAYHFAIPRLFLDAHRIFAIPWITALQPLGQHMHFAAGIALGGELGAAVVSYGIFVLLLITTVAVGAHWYSRPVGLWAAVLLCAAPVVVATAGSGHVENALAVHATLAIWCVVHGLRSGSPRHFAIAGVLIGASLGIKYYALISAGALGLMLVAVTTIRRGPAEAARAALAFGIPMLVVGAPWYVRNAIITGNPFFPEFDALFPTRMWAQAAEFSEWTQLEKRAGGEGLMALLRSPWGVTVRGVDFGTPQFGIGPVVLAMAPVVVARSLRGSDASSTRRVVLAVAALFWTVWFLLAFQRARHLLPVVPALTILSADAALYLAGRRERVYQITSRVFLAACVAFALALSAAYNVQFVRVAVGAEPRAAYLRNQIAVYPEIEWLNGTLTHRDTVAHFLRTMNAHLDVPYRHLSPFSSLEIDWMRLRGGGELVDIMCGLGVTHMVADLNALEPGAESLTGTLARHFTSTVSDALESTGAFTELYSSDRTVPRFRTLDRGSLPLRMRIYALRCPGSGTPERSR